MRAKKRRTRSGQQLAKGTKGASGVGREGQKTWP